MERARRHLVADLEPMAPPAIAFPVRHPTQADAEALDKCAERGRQLDGSANRSLEPNFVALHGDTMASATLVSVRDPMPTVS